MRPPKKFLLFSTDENQLSTLSFMLEIHGYRVLKAETVEEAERLFKGSIVDLVLADVGFALSEIRKTLAMISKMKAERGHIPILLLGDKKEQYTYSADMVLDRNVPPVDLLVRIKVMSARKRGPRKGTPRVAA